MAFIDEIKTEVDAALAKLDEVPLVEPGTDHKKAVIELLKMALKNEIEASQIAAVWMPTTAEMDCKLGLARQCGDEAKHYRLIEKRLQELGFDTAHFSPIASGYTPLYKYLLNLETTVERMAAGPFTREAIAVKRNNQFASYLKASGDHASAAIYVDTIQPDEEWHHRLGLEMVKKYAITPAQQAQARSAAIATLALADELREVAIARVGLAAVPGC